MTRNKWIVVAVAAVAVVTVVISIVVVAATGTRSADVTASSVAVGTDPQSVLTGPVSAEADATPRAAWRSTASGHGSWIEVDFGRSRSIDHVAALGGSDAGFRSALLTFDDARSLAIEADGAGLAEADFPAVQASRVRLTMVSTRDDAPAGLAGLRLDGSGGYSAGDPSPTPTASSAAAGHSAAALLDGDIGTGKPAGEWLASARDGAPWVRLSWDRPIELSSVQIAGPSTRTVDPKRTAAADLHGTLRFSDGGSVTVPAIEGGDGAPTTLAFAPRVVSSVTLRLGRTVGDAELALREFRAYAAGTTPPRWPQAGGHRVSATKTDASCPTSDGGSDARLTLVCPLTGAVVGDSVDLTIRATRGDSLTVSGRPSSGGRVSGPVQDVARGTADDSGVAKLTVPLADFPRGPLTLEVGVDGGSAEDTLPVQLFHAEGDRLVSRGFAPDGMTLAWDEEFDRPLSASATGRGATYAAAKPEPYGSSGFGDAVFADPSDGLDNLVTIGGDLRVRVAPLSGDSDVRADHGQTSTGGLLSSARVGGGGFGAQYGYFEARMIGAPGRGSWPAFWMLDMPSAAATTRYGTEVDAVELYGHDTAQTCHSVHLYDGGEPDGGSTSCVSGGDVSDWSSTWHTYGVRVMPGSATFYVDGQEVAHKDDLTTDDRPMYFLIDLALGGGWPVDLDATRGRTDLYVDWVRAYT